MGFFSKIQQYHGAGESPNENNMAEFGVPARSLFTRLNPGDLHQRIDITDEADNVLYYTKSSIFALKGKTDILDSGDSQVAHLEKKPVSLHEKQFITMADGRKFTLSNELFHLVKDITNIDGLGWQIQGNIVGLNFRLLDETGSPVAVIGQKALSLHDRYCIDLYQPQNEQVVVAIVIALQKMLNARRENESSSSFSFGSD